MSTYRNDNGQLEYEIIHCPNCSYPVRKTINPIAEKVPLDTLLVRTTQIVDKLFAMCVESKLDAKQSDRLESLFESLEASVDALKAKIGEQTR